jgi:hypothetical protein
VNFRPASFRRFVRDITRGPDDLMALADAVAVSPLDEYAAAHAAHELTDARLAAVLADWSAEQ